MRMLIAAALGAAMLTGSGAPSARAGALGPLHGHDFATTATAHDSISNAYYGGGHGYGYGRGHWGGRRHWGGHRRYGGWGHGGGHRSCFWRPTPWGPERICRW